MTVIGPHYCRPGSLRQGHARIFGLILLALSTGCDSGSPPDGGHGGERHWNERVLTPGVLCVSTLSGNNRIEAGDRLKVALGIADMCQSSSCFVGRTTACSVKPDANVANDRWVQGRLVATVDPVGPCTPDCGAPKPWAFCETEPLDAGTWRFHAHDIVVSVQVPGPVEPLCHHHQPQPFPFPAGSPDSPQGGHHSPSSSRRDLLKVPPDGAPLQRDSQLPTIRMTRLSR